MKKPEIEVKLYDANDAFTYVPLPGDHYVHAFIGKQGELRINSVRVAEDADIEKNKQELVITEYVVFAKGIWSFFQNTAAT